MIVTDSSLQAALTALNNKVQRKAQTWDSVTADNIKKINAGDSVGSGEIVLFRFGTGSRVRCGTFMSSAAGKVTLKTYDLQSATKVGTVTSEFAYDADLTAYTTAEIDSIIASAV
jgi:hypothetical protein